MYAPRILSSLGFSISELWIERGESIWKVTPEYEESVRTEWDALLRETKTPIWEGTYYRVLNPDVFGEKTEPAPVVLGTVAYRYVAIFPALSREHSRCALEPLYHLSTAALIRTADDLYIFGVRNGTGALDLIGGGAQCDEIEIASGVDLERNLYKEIYEETGLARGDIEELRGIGVVLLSTSNVLIVGHARLKVGSAEILKTFQQRTDDEMKRLVFVGQENVREFLMTMPDYRSLLPSLLW